jgi:hypothetical protein
MFGKTPARYSSRSKWKSCRHATLAGLPLEDRVEGMAEVSLAQCNCGLVISRRARCQTNWVDTILQRTIPTFRKPTTKGQILAKLRAYKWGIRRRTVSPGAGSGKW